MSNRVGLFASALSLLILAAVSASAEPSDAAEPFLGDWTMTTRMGGGSMEAAMTIERGEGGALEGSYSTRGMEMTLERIEIEGSRITFDREIPGGDVVHFEGELAGDLLEGSWTGAFGEATCIGRRGAAVPATGGAATGEEIPNRHERPIVERDGRRLLWAGEDDAGNVDWFDMTDSTIDPERFQFGIGKDTIPSIDDPEFVSVEDPRLAARGVTRETPVLGVSIDGIARAYPVRVMDLHEVVNDDFGGKAYAVLW